MMTVKIKKMVGTKDGILVTTEKGEFLLSFDEMSKYPNQPLPSGNEIEIKSYGDGNATVKIGGLQMRYSEKWLKKRNLL